MTALRPYQTAAVGAVLAALREHRSALLVLPTGTGKTVIMGELVRLGFARGRRVLLLAHRSELLQQAADKFQRHVPGLRVGVEQAGDRVDVAALPDVVVASVQSLQRSTRLERFEPNTFALVLVDEAHHATADGYRRVLGHFAGAKVVGVTATADRLDGEALGEVFEVAPFTYDIRSAIADGWLAPIVQRRVVVQSLDLSRVRTTAGDLNAVDLERELTSSAVLAEVAGPLVTLAEARPTIVFAAAVAQAHALAEVMTGLGAGAVAIDGSASAELRQTTLDRFASGQVQFLINCALFTEGFDAPSTSCIAVVRPTKSRALYTQMIGRGLRLSPESGKSNCLVLDFVGNAGRHKLISPVDVLAGTDAADEVRRAARELAERDPEMPLHTALDTAAEAIARARRVHFETIDVDPFALAALGLEMRDMRGSGGPATQRQISALQSAGVRADWARLTKGQASTLLGGVTQRRERGLCTVKQATQLAKRGLNPDVPFELARAALDSIAANDWRTPEWLRKDARFKASGERAA